MFEKEKELYARLDSVADGEVITLSSEDANRLAGIVEGYLAFRRAELSMGEWL
jgi:hypothetical protein